jgi:dihydroorotase
MIESKLMNWATLVERMSTTPAKIAGYKNQGQQIEVGSVANLILLDQSVNWQVDRKQLHSKSKNTPFDGMQLPGVVTYTIYNGNLVFQRSK